MGDQNKQFWINPVLAGIAIKYGQNKCACLIYLNSNHLVYLMKLVLLKNKKNLASRKIRLMVVMQDSWWMMTFS